LTNFSAKEGVIGQPFLLACGAEAGKNLLITQTSAVPYLQWDDTATCQALAFVQKYRQVRTCGTPDLSGVRSLCADPFTTDTLVSWIVERVMYNADLPHFHRLWTSFICGSHGYHVRSASTLTFKEMVDHVNGNNLYDPDLKEKSPHKVPAPFIFDFLTQLTIILIELRNYNFCHGSAQLHQVVFMKEPSSYEYDGYPVTCPFTLALTDFRYSSCTVNGIHLFSRNEGRALHLNNAAFIAEIETKQAAMAYCQQAKVCPVDNSSDSSKLRDTCRQVKDACAVKTANFYRLKSENISIYNHMRHIGFPLFVGSFDVYVFLISLLLEPGVFQTVLQSDRLYRIWSAIWLYSDIKTVEEDLKQALYDRTRLADPDYRTNVCLTILKGRWLRCDAVDHLWRLIKTS